MNDIDNFFKNIASTYEPETQKIKPEKKKYERRVRIQIDPARLSYEKANINQKTLQQLKNRYIAFDTETTGMNPEKGRIVEVGAVLFEDGQPVDSFGSLIHVDQHISYSASAVNHITDDMLLDAPEETEVYEKLIAFFGDAMNGETMICAHNAVFDMKFLVNTFNRLGYQAHFRYVDTVSLSRRYVKGLPNYKQDTVGRHFGLYNRNAHRALEDAEVCGGILSHILNILEEEDGF